MNIKFFIVGLFLILGSLFAIGAEIPQNINRPINFNKPVEVTGTNSFSIGGSIVFTLPGSSSISGEVIDNDNIINNAISTPKIQDGSITSNKLSINSVGKSNLTENSVNSDKIEDGSIKREDIFTGAIGVNQLTNDAVTSAKILDGTITSNDIGSGQIINTHISNDTINGGKLVDGSVLPAKLVSGAIGYLTSQSPYISTYSAANFNSWLNGYSKDQLRVVYCTWRNNSASAITIFATIRDPSFTEVIVVSSRNSSFDEYINFSFVVPQGWDFKVGPSGSIPGTLIVENFKSIGIGKP